MRFLCFFDYTLYRLSIPFPITNNLFKKQQHAAVTTAQIINLKFEIINPIYAV